MARNTQLFYDWNNDVNGFIWPGNIFNESKAPFIRGDKDDSENTEDLDEADYDIGFNDDDTRNFTLVKMDVYGDLSKDDEGKFIVPETYRQYASDKYVYQVYVGVMAEGTMPLYPELYKRGIKYNGYLSEGLNNVEGTKETLWLFDAGSRQIIGKTETGETLLAQAFTLSTLKFSPDDGFYFLVGNTKYLPFSQSLNCYLKDLSVGGFAAWDEHNELKLLIPKVGSECWNGIPVYYKKRNLFNLQKYRPEAIKKHDNEIVAMFAEVPLVDKINLFDVDATTKKVTSVYYYKTREIIGSFCVWVKNMRRLWPHIDGRNADEVLDNALADESKAWMTPEEFYNKNTTTTKNIKSGQDGYTIAKVKTKDTEEKKTIPVWFWVNSLANWCTFKHNERHCTELCVWNGRNGWDELDDIIKPNSDARIILYTYFYDWTRFIRGVNVSSKIYRNNRMRYKYIKLPFESKFSQYDENNFQCIKIGRVHLDDKGMQRYPFSTGIPPVMRLPSGELALIYHLVLPGMTKKHEVIWPDNMDFINSVCQAYFGKGDDKTIKDDWKRFYKLKDVLEEKASEVVTDDVSTLIKAEEINTIREDNVLQNVTLNIPRQYPETLDATPDSYVEDWRQ